MNRILILDDNERFADTLKRSISNFDEYDTELVEAVSTSLEAMTLTQRVSENKQPFTVFLIDQNLGSEMDGIQIMKELLAISPDADAIIFTGFEIPQDGMRAYEEGASRYLPKPFEPRELEFILKELSRSRKVRLEEARQRRQFKVATSIAEAVGTSLDVKTTVDAGLGTLCEMFDNTRLCLLLYDQYQGVLRFAPGALKYYEIENSQYTQQAIFPLEQGSIACRVAKSTLINRHMECENIGDVSQDADYKNLNPNTKSECCVSLLNSNQELSGVLVLEREWLNGFAEGDLDLIKMAARHIGIAINRAQQSEALNLKSTIDNMYHRQLRVFICHASQDKPAVQELYSALKSEGWIDPWFDKAKILPGQDWEMVIEKAVDDSDVVLVCLSNQSVSKEGFVQREIRYAYDIALEKPDGTIFLIPLRLGDCVVPRKLKTFHWVDYFGFEKQSAYSDLLESLRLRHEQNCNDESYGDK